MSAQESPTTDSSGIEVTKQESIENAYGKLTSNGKDPDKSEKSPSKVDTETETEQDNQPTSLANPHSSSVSLAVIKEIGTSVTRFSVVDQGAPVKKEEFDPRKETMLRIAYPSKRSRDWSVFEWAADEERRNSKRVLEWLVEEAERKLSIKDNLERLMATDKTLGGRCSVFGQQNLIFKLIQQEADYLHDSGKHSLGWMLRLWSGQLIYPSRHARECGLKCDVIENITSFYNTRRQSNDVTPLRALADEAEHDGQYHVAATYMLHMRTVSDIRKAIQLLQDHHFYRDAAILARFRLEINDDQLKGLFEKWASVQTDRSKHEEAAKCYMLTGKYTQAAKSLSACGNGLELLLLACRIGRLMLASKSPDQPSAGTVALRRLDEQQKEMVSDLGVKTLLVAIAQCQWSTAEKVASMMGVHKGWCGLVMVHQALVCRLRTQFEYMSHLDSPLRVPESNFPEWVVSLAASGNSFLRDLWKRIEETCFTEWDTETMVPLLDDMLGYYNRLKTDRLFGASDSNPTEIAGTIAIELMLGMLSARMAEIGRAQEIFQKCMLPFNEGLKSAMTEILNGALIEVARSSTEDDVDKQLVAALGFLCTSEDEGISEGEVEDSDGKAALESEMAMKIQSDILGIVENETGGLSSLEMLSVDMGDFRIETDGNTAQGEPTEDKETGGSSTAGGSTPVTDTETTAASGLGEENAAAASKRKPSKKSSSSQKKNKRNKQRKSR